MLGILAMKMRYGSTVDFRFKKKYMVNVQVEILSIRLHKLGW